MRAARPYSRSTSLRTVSGSGSASSLALQLLEVVGTLAFAELVLDRLELLAQVELALLVAELLAHLALDVFLGLEHRELALDVNQDAAQALFDRQGFQQSLALGGRHLGVSGDEVGQTAGVLDRRDDLLDDVLRQAGALTELRGALARLAYQSDESGIPRIERRHLIGRLDGGDQVTVLLRVTHCNTPALALDEQLDTRQAALHLGDARHGTDGVELVGLDLAARLALGYREDQPLGRGEGRVDRAQGAGTSGDDRHRHTRQDHRFTQGQDRQGLDIAHVFSTRRDRLQGSVPRAA